MVNNSTNKTIMPMQPNQPDDLKLIEKITDKDKKAFEQLYNKYSQTIYNLAYRIFNNKEEASEATQDIFLQVWSKAPSYDHKRARVSTWIMTIARTRCIDRLRAGSKHSRNYELNEEIVNSNSVISRILDVEYEQKEIIKKALEALPDNQRKAIETVYFEGLTHHETAVKLGVPVGTIKTRIRLGVIKLREFLAEYYEDIK